MDASNPAIHATLAELTIPLASVSRYEGNPRTHDLPRLKDSLERNGQFRPVVVNRRTMTVLAGNGTHEAAEQLGWPSLAATFVDVDEQQAARIVAVDNRVSDLAGYDDQALLDLLHGLPDLEGTGYTDEELAELEGLVRGGSGAGGLTDPDAVPEAPGEPVTRPGDLWLLGDHRLLAGDALSEEDVARLMAGDLADVLVTDPPYGVDYAAKNAFLNAVGRGNAVQERILGDGEAAEDMRPFWTAAFTVAKGAMRPGAAYYVTGPQGGDLLLLLLSMKDAGLLLKHMIVWVKNNLVLGRSDYHYKHEPVLYGWIEGAGHSFYGPAGETSVWEIDKPHASRLGPVMKPVALYERALRNSARPGDVLLDLFGGTGTALIAAHATDTRARVCELDCHYVDVAARRWQEHTGEKPVLEATGEPHDFTSPP